MKLQKTTHWGCSAYGLLIVGSWEKDSVVVSFSVTAMWGHINGCNPTLNYKAKPTLTAVSLAVLLLNPLHQANIWL